MRTSTSSWALGTRTGGDVVVGVLLSSELVARGTITITASGVIRGDVVSDEVVVAGRVEGSVRAQRVVLLETAEIDGGVCCIELSRAEGARVTGDCAAIRLLPARVAHEVFSSHPADDSPPRSLPTRPLGSMGRVAERRPPRARDDRFRPDAMVPRDRSQFRTGLRALTPARFLFTGTAALAIACLVTLVAWRLENTAIERLEIARSLPQGSEVVPGPPLPTEPETAVPPGPSRPSAPDPRAPRTSPPPLRLPTHLPARPPLPRFPGDSAQKPSKPTPPLRIVIPKHLPPQPPFPFPSLPPSPRDDGTFDDR